MSKSRFYPVPLTKLYKLLARLDPEASVDDVLKLLGLKSKRTATRYLSTLRWIRSRLRRVGSFDEFMDGLLTILLREFKLEDAVRKLSSAGVPITYTSLISSLKDENVEITPTEARAMINWLKQLDALRERKIPILVTSLEERVLEDVRQRGAVTYSTLAKKYGDSVRDTLVELWKRGLLDIPVLEKYREILEKAENLDKLPPNLKGRLFATWQDRITGETYSELVIPPRARISARWAF